LLQAAVTIFIMPTSIAQKRKLNDQLNEERTPQSNHQPKSNKVKKQKKKSVFNPYDVPEISNHITKCKVSHQPGSPSSVFQTSYQVSLSSKNSIAITSTENIAQTQTQTQTQTHASATKSNPVLSDQIVHCHQNSLCIITAGNSIMKDCKITKIEYLKTVDPTKTGGKNKKRKGMKMSHTAVQPSDPLVKIHYSNDSTQLLYSCVYGTLLEFNSRLIQTPLLLQKDPLMNGYLAIILPLRPFPPISHLS